MGPIHLWLQRWRRSPLLTTQYVLTVAIGMAAVAAVASLLYALGFEPLPFRQPSQLVSFWEQSQTTSSVMALSGPDLADMAAATPAQFSSLGYFSPDGGMWLLDAGSAPIKFEMDALAPAALRDLGIRPALGRGILPSDRRTANGAVNPAWISNHLWRTHFGANPRVIGSTIRYALNASGADAQSLQIVGVLPPRAVLPLPFIIQANADAIWTTLPDMSHRARQGFGLFGFGRLRPGVTAAQAQAALTAVAARLGDQYYFDRHKTAVVQTFSAIAQGPARRTVGLLSLAIALLLLVACLNVAILMVAEGSRRRIEVAIRAALGAARARQWREIAAEKCALTAIALALGAALAGLFLRLLVQLVPAAGLGAPLASPPPLNLLILAAFAAFALFVALAWSALVVASADPHGSSRTLAAGSALAGNPRPAARSRLTLLAAQAALGMCLLAAAALAARTYAALSRADLGPAPARTTLLRLEPSNNGVLNGAQSLLYQHHLLARLARLPGVLSVALADDIAPSGNPWWFRKRDDPASAQRPVLSPFSITSNYFPAFGIPILYGRSLAPADALPGADPVGVINVEMAARNWPSPAQAVGDDIIVGTKNPLHFRIVGVAANFNGYWQQQSAPTLYVPMNGFDAGEAILTTRRPSPNLSALTRQALAGMAIPTDVQSDGTMQSNWDASLTRPRARTAGMLLLALLALGLAVQGVYAVAAAAVEARRHELAIRSALGASSASLRWTATRALLLAVFIGAAAGLAAALDLQPLLAHWLGATPRDPILPLAAAALLLALSALAGSTFPARAAAHVNPADALRQS